MSPGTCCREDKYAITDEELRPYFALPNVLDGLFGLAKRLFDVDIEAADGEVGSAPSAMSIEIKLWKALSAGFVCGTDGAIAVRMLSWRCLRMSCSGKAAHM